MTARAGVIGLAVALLTACGFDAAWSRAPQLITRAHQTMGSEVRVTVWTADEAMVESAAAAVFAEFDRLDALLSVWQPGSDVLRVNAAAGRGPVRVSRETIDVLQAARRGSDLTDGKFDVTFGALADVWKFDHDRDNRIPSAEEIATRLPLVDYHAVVVDAPAGTVFLTRPGVRVHLGGIGKGYAVDRAVAMLRARGLRDFMVQFGGDMFVSGAPGDEPWRLGISDPRGAPGDSFAMAELRDVTFSTSGDYERFFLDGGRRYHHVLDPDTGWPANGCVSVTIVAKSATDAETLSKGVFILGPEKGMALVERLPDVEAVVVTAANDVLISSGLHSVLRVLHAPTPARP